MSRVGRLLVTAVVLAAIVFGLDRGAAFGLSRLAASQAENTAGGTADVHLLGFPFLTQLGRGDLTHVRIHQTELRSSVLTLDTLDADAHGVHLSFLDALRGRVSSVPVDAVSGSAVIAYSSLADAVNGQLGGAGKAVSISFRADGTDKITTTVHGPLGLDASQAVPVPTVSGGTLQLGGLIQDVTSLIPGAVANAAQLPLPSLPYGLRLQRAQARSDGLHLTVTGRNVTLPTR